MLEKFNEHIGTLLMITDSEFGSGGHIVISFEEYGRYQDIFAILYSLETQTYIEVDVVELGRLFQNKRIEVIK